MIRLEGKDYRYIAKVLRQGPGDSFRALLPDGVETTLEIRGAVPGCLECVLVAGTESPEPPGMGASFPPGTRKASGSLLQVDSARKGALPILPPIVLIQALPKGPKMDLIVRQATEAGVSLILPFIAQRSVSRPDSGSEAIAKKDRWTRIVREARQQSGSDLATMVTEPMTLDAALARWRTYIGDRASPVGIFLHQDPLAQGTFHSYLGLGPDTVALAIGPEGGFSPLEVEKLVAAHFLPVLLGANVLRTETAAIFALAAVHAILLEKASWIPRTPDSPA